jgi:hypothetical protein
MIKNLDIEKIGTDLVIAYEKIQGRDISKPKVKGCGWDLCTGDDKETRYIEVKATTKKRLEGRWLEKAGHNQLQTNPEFFIYVITNIDENDISKGDIKIYTKEDVTIVEEIKYMLKLRDASQDKPVL